MRIPAGKSIFVQTKILLLITAGIFILDLFTPLGWADWVLYFFPLVLTLQSPRERDPYTFAALITCLMVVGVLFHREIDPLLSLFNRGVGLTVIWLFAWMIVRQKQAWLQFAGAQAAHASAETHREAAIAARELAEASALGAAHRETQTARELLTSSLRLESILQSAMDAIITIDERQCVLLFNDAAERMFQRPAAEAIGQLLDQFIPARFREEHYDHIQRFGRSGVTSRKMGKLGMVTGLRRNGEEFPVEAAISQISIEGKKFYTVILRDTTDREQTNRLLRQSEERYRRLISVSPFAIVVIRGDRVMFINDAGLRLIGAVKAEEILGKSLFDLSHPESHALVRDRLNQLIEGSPTVPVLEEKVVTLDGSVIDVEFSAASFTDEEGPAIVVTMRDIGERKRLQEQLRKTERIAELGTLASGMAHEIGTPMNVILGRAEYLMDRVNEEPVKKGLKTIVEQVERITKVMNQLLAFARRKPHERGPLDLKDIVENSVEMFEERLAKSRVRVETHIDEHCPKVLADNDQMNQVLINLIMNAVHAMPEGGTLRIRLAQAQDMVRLTVTDTGQGIPQEELKKIFEPFFTTKEFGKGTGLGLTVVKGIVEEHQGVITVESEAGKGTTFTILLPKSE